MVGRFLPPRIPPCAEPSESESNSGGAVVQAAQRCLPRGGRFRIVEEPAASQKGGSVLHVFERMNTKLICLYHAARVVRWFYTGVLRICAAADPGAGCVVSIRARFACRSLPTRHADCFVPVAPRCMLSPSWSSVESLPHTSTNVPHLPPQKRVPHAGNARNRACFPRLRGSPTISLPSPIGPSLGSSGTHSEEAGFSF